RSPLLSACAKKGSGSVILEVQTPFSHRLRAYPEKGTGPVMVGVLSPFGPAALIHAPGDAVRSHRAFVGRPLISCLTRLRTVWTYRRLLRTDAFSSAKVSNSRLCVARRRSTFQKRSIGFSFGLYDGSRYNSRCGLSAKAAVTSAPRCQGALSMTNTTRRWRPFGYVLPTCRRCAANAACIRRFLLG